MQETKVIKILNTLTPEEFKNFGKFIESPYHNPSKVIVKFFKILKKHYPDFNNADFKIEKIYKKLYPSQKYNYGTIRNVISEVGILAEKFLSHEYYKDKEYIIKFGELQMLRSKNVSALKEKLLNNLMEKYGKAKGFMEDHFNVGIDLNNMKLVDVFDEGNLHKNTYVYTQRTEYAMFFALDYMIHSKLEEHTNESRNLKYVDYAAKMYDCFDFEKFLKYVEKNSPEIYEIIAIEHYVVKMNLNDDFKQSAEKFEKLFYKNYKSFSKRYLFSLYLNFSNSYITQINSFVQIDTAKTYANKLLNLYDIFFQERVYKAHYSYISKEEFLNLIRVSEVSGNYEKMKNYIIDFIEETNPDDRDVLRNFAEAEYYFGVGNYEAALNSYNGILKPFPRLSLSIKTGMMICHFYLRNFETALSLTHAFIRDADRKLKSKTGSIAGLTQVKFIKKLLMIVMSADPKVKLDALENEIKKSGMRYNAKILNMINSIKKK